MSWDSQGHKFEQRGSDVYLDGRMVGWITRLGDGTRIFVSPRDRAKHYFRIWTGWGISKALLEYLKNIVHIKEIHLKVGKMLLLISKIEDWEHAIPYHKEPYEPQVVLPERRFEKHVLTMAEMIG